MQSGSARPRLAVVGSINTDLVVYGQHLPGPGETIVGSDLFTGGGGKGANQAIAIARLGASVTLIGRVGDDDFGRAALANLGRAGVDVAQVGVSTDAPSGVALIVVDRQGQNQIAVAPGANWRLTPEDVASAWPALAGCAAVLMQLEVPLATVQRAAALARAAGLMVLLNPAPTPVDGLPDALLALVDVILPNEAEAAALSGVAVAGESGAEAAARAILARGPRAAVVTLGKAGALVVEGERATRVPAVSVEAVDATAAGDAFCGGFAVALAQGRDLVAASRYGNLVAGVAVTRQGAQGAMPSAADVDALAARLAGAARS